MKRTHLCALTLLTAGAYAQPIYKVYEWLPDARSAWANSLNENNVACGYATINDSAKHWVGSRLGEYSFLDAPSGQFVSTLTGLNDSEWVCGIVQSEIPNSYQGCVWNPLHQPTLIGWHPGLNVSELFDINNNQVACGSVRDTHVTIRKAIKWSASTGMVLLPPLPGRTLSGATAIIDDGSVFGSSTAGTTETATRWTPSGTPVALQPVIGYSNSAVGSANQNGVAAGASYDEPWYVPTKWGVDGQPVELPRLNSAPQGSISSIDSIGNMVGAIGNHWSSIACYWPASGGVVDLNTRIDPTTPGWILYSAKRINDNGVLIGLGKHNGRDNVWYVAEPIESTEVSVQDITLNLGQIRLGDIHSLKAVDGDCLQVARFLVPNVVTSVKFSITGIDPYPTLSTLSFETYSKISSAGAFVQKHELFNFQTGDYDTVDTRTDGMSMSYTTVKLSATGSVARYRRSDGLLRSRLTVVQVGPSARSDWWGIYDYMAWKVRP